MGIRISHGAALGDPATLYDSTEGISFGPTFEHSEHAEDFLQWYRALSDDDLKRFHSPSTAALYVTASAWKRIYAEWFDERVDGESGLLKADIERIGARLGEREVTT